MKTLVTATSIVLNGCLWAGMGIIGIQCYVPLTAIIFVCGAMFGFTSMLIYLVIKDNYEG